MMKVHMLLHKSDNKIWYTHSHHIQDGIFKHVLHAITIHQDKNQSNLNHWWKDWKSKLNNLKSYTDIV